MDTRLLVLIRDYQIAVSRAVELLIDSGIARPASDTSWAALDIPPHGQLNGGVRYYKHGYGCAVHLPGGAVDFDFGASGEIEGFDEWRLRAFACTRLGTYGFSNELELKDAFKAAVQSHEFRFSGYILYYLPSEHPI